MDLHLPEYFVGDLLATIAFGVLAILLVVIGYHVFDRLTPKLDFNELLNKGNMAMAVVIGSFLLGLCYVIGRVVAAILGGQ
jgi:putative membrane protein